MILAANISMELSECRRLTKNEKRRLRKKKVEDGVSLNLTKDIRNIGSFDDKVEIEYVSPDFNFDIDIYQQFREVFDKFAKPEELLSEKRLHDEMQLPSTDEISNNEDEIVENPIATLSKKKKKLLSRLSVSELKQLVARPDVVEAHDVTSSDPRLLIHLKGYRNTVPVPRHWCHVRKYLQGKRGIEKIPFQLPEYIAETGIAKIRETVLEQEAMKKSKQKARERIRPKMGRIDIDYQVLHDAFFKYQTKPKMTGHGDLYYEGKEFEVQAKEKRPGILSSELISALGMQDGGPPPWLINMQRYGPPPSYPNLRIPGLNAPLPPGAAYGYQPGGWGKPPVDDYGRPLYGDVFGVSSTNEADYGPFVDKNYRWGTFEVEEFDEMDESDEDDEDDENMDESGPKVLSLESETSGLETPAVIDGTHSIVSGVETPATIDLRKRTGTETPDVGGSRDLYQIIKDKKTNSSVSGQFFGSERTYVFPEVSENQNGQSQIKEDINQNSMLRHMNNYSIDGMETEEDKLKGGKKRKAEQTIIKKVKEFKF